jgi:hypothetical protein
VLKIYRRHAADCRHKSTREWRCSCPIWAHGTLGPQNVRRSVGLVNWDAAQRLVARWDSQGFIDGEPEPLTRERPGENTTPPLLTVERAIEEFFLDLESQQLGSDSIKKYRPVLKHLREFSDKKGFRYVIEFDPRNISAFRNTWTQAPITQFKNLERPKTFFNYCVSMRTIESSPAAALKPPRVDQSPTLPFSTEEMHKLLASCDQHVGLSKN